MKPTDYNVGPTQYSPIDTPPPGSNPLRVVSAPNKPTATPGGVWRRFVAVFIDTMILNIAQFPFAFGAGLIIGMANHSLGLNFEESLLQIFAALVGWGIGLVFMFVYFGWFYKNKGGSAGKLIMGLRVVDTLTGTNIGYWRAFLREIVGRILDFMTLLIGLFMALFREDKRCLHDFVARTQVLRKE